jgi:hypothetical protein
MRVAVFLDPNELSYHREAALQGTPCFMQENKPPNDMEGISEVDPLGLAVRYMYQVA